MSNENYSVEFYHKHYEGSYTSASIILSYLKQYLCINSIVDFGCGIGTWCVAAAELGIPTICGIDSNSLPRTQIKDLTIDYKNLDLSKNITLQYQFDLAISVEVAEHIPETDINTYLKNITATSNIILFSAAIPGQEGLNHVNEQPLSYWVKKFQELDYEILDVLRGEFWNNLNIEIWYRNNIVLFIHKAFWKEISSKFPQPKPIVDIVHPELFKRKIIKYKGSI